MSIPAAEDPPSIGGPINPDRVIHLSDEVWNAIRGATRSPSGGWFVKGREVQLVASVIGVVRLAPVPPTS